MGDIGPRWWTAWAGRGRARADRQEPPSVDADHDALRLVVSTWSPEQLRWAWRTSMLRTDHPDPRLRAQTAEQRAILLDEIERRDPAAFASWLASHPTADASPPSAI